MSGHECQRHIGRSRHVLAFATCLVAVAFSLPQTSQNAGSKLSASDSGDVAIAVSGHANAIRAHTTGDTRQSPHVRREAHGAGELVQMGQPAGQNLTEHPPTLSAKDAADRLEQDGIVDTFNAATDESQEVKLEEETIECMMDTPVWECMEKHGSYGVRRLYTDKVEDYGTLKSWRKDWMGNTNVQNKRLFEITWPGTHESGAYGYDSAIIDTNESSQASVKGSITQHLDVYSQLEVGVRALEVQVAVGKKDGQLYSANGALTMSLASILTDIASFLETHHKEVVLLYMKKAEVYNGIELAHVQPLRDEEKNPQAIPGESVHKGVEAVIGKHLASYKALASMPATEAAENPTIQAAIAAGIRVFYFWEGQQVLCISKAECAQTPGWERGTLGQPLAFGPGLPLGARTNLNHGTGTQTYVEPGCIHSSTTATQSSNPMQLVLNVKKYTDALMDSAKKHPTACFPTDAAIPPIHTPTLLYEVDLWASPFTEAEGAYRKVYQNIEEIYTRGESATLKSEAERVNYLILNWLFRKNWGPMFTKLSIISMDYIAPINVQRIIEANQAGPDTEDCGYAIYCKVTGSCWAETMLDAKSGACIPETTVLDFLKWHAEGRPMPWYVWFVMGILTLIFVKLCLCGTACFLCGNNCIPTCFPEGGVGCLWMARKKKEEPPVETSEADIAALVADDDLVPFPDDHHEEPEQQVMAGGSGDF